MNTLTRFAFVLLAVPAQAQTTLPNFGSVDPTGVIFRGAQPNSKTGELKKLGIQEVLIVKRQTANEVDVERERLRDLGIHADYIPMDWNHADVKLLCNQVVEAVQFLQAQKRARKKTYFHCTMGQDRTGAVAGLFRMVDQGWSASRAFKEEMCPHGYSDGAKGKPARIITEIEKSLTPIFLALSKSLTPQGLNASACNRVEIPAVIPTCRKLASGDNAH
jgi:protein tyrosine/serine phosphatase